MQKPSLYMVSTTSNLDGEEDVLFYKGRGDLFIDKPSKIALRGEEGIRKIIITPKEDGLTLDETYQNLNIFIAFKKDNLGKMKVKLKMGQKEREITYLLTSCIYKLSEDEFYFSYKTIDEERNCILQNKIIIRKEV